MIKVLVLDTVMDRGGAEAMIMNYMRNINRDAISFDFLTNRDYRAAFEDEIEELGGKVFHMSPQLPGHFREYKKEMREFLREHREYQIVHSNLEERSYLPLKIAKEENVKVRISHAHNRPLGFDIKTLVRYYFRARLPKVVTHMFACGREAGEWLYGAKRKDRITIMNNAIDAKAYTYDKELALKVKEELGVSGKTVIGHVGRFFAQKNHDFLIDIFAQVHKDDPNTVLMLVGGGELDDSLKNQIKDKVKRLGLEDTVLFLGVRDDVNRVIQAFDVFVLPSLFEGLPVTMIEAQAAGLPCVISDKVPSDCDITGNVKIIKLEDDVNIWASEILEYVNNFERKDTYELIKSAGFDIMENAVWLENFYKEALDRA